jgi:hypothetical protein
MDEVVIMQHFLAPDNLNICHELEDLETINNLVLMCMFG